MPFGVVGVDGGPQFGRDVLFLSIRPRSNRTPRLDTVQMSGLSHLIGLLPVRRETGEVLDRQLRRPVAPIRDAD